MEKKKVKKTKKKIEPIVRAEEPVKVVEKVEPEFSKLERLFLDNSRAIGVLKEVIVALEQRIDRIVGAISKSKKVKGL